jgi:hypothetical protein
LWKSRRSEEKIKAIDARIAGFSSRLANLRPSEAKTVRRALTRLAGIETLDDGQFGELAGAILTAWEAGRLREIIEDVARMDDMDAGVLMSLLVEHQVLSALHVAEVVKLKVDVINGLRRRISQKELETAVRDYIAKEPWLISPRWETFRVEVRIVNLANEAAQASGVADDDDWKGRVDLVLSSGHELLVLEFMRPGLPIDRNHIDRFQRYIDILRTKVQANSSLQFHSVMGLLVADKLAKKPEDVALIQRMAAAGMYCQEWSVLLTEASVQWGEFLQAIVERAPVDERIQALGLKNKSPREGDASTAS